MGRHSGFIAAHATLGNADVNFCLVPEVPAVLEGDLGFLRALARRLDQKHHAVVVVAEGAGQTLVRDAGQTDRDASGNLRLKDIGRFLRERIMQDSNKDGSTRYYTYGVPFFNYGLLPQTWEDPSLLRNGYGGDNDPLDVMEIGSVPLPMGSVVSVKVLGSLELIDEGETDHKVRVIRHCFIFI